MLKKNLKTLCYPGKAGMAYKKKYSIKNTKKISLFNKNKWKRLMLFANIKKSHLYNIYNHKKFLINKKVLKTIGLPGLSFLRMPPLKATLTTNSKALKIYKKGLKLTKVQKDIIHGLLLSDGCMGRRLGKPFYGLRFSQCYKRRAFVNHIYYSLRNFCGAKPKVNEKQGSKFLEMAFSTYTHVCFKPFWHSYYKIEYSKNIKEEKLIKKMPSNIEQILNQRVLAYLFMGDGTSQKNQAKYGKPGLKKYSLCTHNFSYEEQLFFCEILKKKFGIKAGVGKDKKKKKIEYLFV